MRLLVTGSRDWGDSELIRRELYTVAAETTASRPVLIHGANGVRPDGSYVQDPSVEADALADRWWRSWGFPVETYRAEWWKYGRGAGMIRNSKMVAEGNASLCLAFIRGRSRGATNCAALAEAAGIPVRRFALAAVAL